MQGEPESIEGRTWLNILQFYRYSILERSGGTYRYIDDLSRALAAQGHQVCFVSTTRNNRQGSAWVERAPGYSIHNLRVSQSRLDRQWELRLEPRK